MTFDLPTVTVERCNRDGDVIVTVVRFVDTPTSPVTPATIWIKQGTKPPDLILDPHKVEP